MIVFVGSNPSMASGSAMPFAVDTKSYKILWSWINAAISIPAVCYHNVSDKPTPNNRPLKISEIKECIPGLQIAMHDHSRIVALGKTAHKALTMAGIPHLELPHPSGLNRKLNCPFYVNEQISKLRDYAYPG